MTRLKFLKNANKVLFGLMMFMGLQSILQACNQKQTYEAIVEEEMARNVTYDSLFYGLHFNMPIKTFYDHSYDMNQKGIFFQNNMNVEVIIHYDEDFSAPVDFVFFPDESYPTIQKVDGYMKFRQWAPFTKEFTAGKLQEELKEKMEDWYGGREFIRIEHPRHHWPYAYVKVDGNRKILLYRSFDDQKVEIVYENLDTALEQ